ncbi:MAG: ribonuclease Y [Candidatus Magasanikbacteria bacterium]|jgi:ribonucrease Y|nr:ribonuclease Y [Candidatus Magasanikbacteria bacterium]MBT4221467.1 ribonuclease Y [Candidatus Magasanikbacteria bacterium]MBT4350685.1 ribonuclease Y [Candidatus Magasanikbacteria bacterium]MBT4541639.1 ribonuclease Y [Candidatus Magasanikbacteria bacterium]MBT6252918.1 ribonuclease Y [Candidatus Magasanikbacteria bacterium]
MLTILIVALIAAGIGALIGYIARKTIAQSKANSAESLAEKRLIEAKNKEQEIILKAKEQAIKSLEDAKKEEEERRKEIRRLQDRIEQRESVFEEKMVQFEGRKVKLQEKADEIKLIKTRIEEKHEEATKEVEKSAGLSREDAKEVLFEKIKETAHEDLLALSLKFDNDNHEQIEEKAQEIMVNTIQRTAANHAAETTSTAVPLPSDEMKGRIIGKDGRNIKTIEKLTGCELIIDETPGLILISGFSPIRRRVCSLALKKLIKDGRIQPAKIEEYILEAKRELAVDIKKAGDNALQGLGIIGIDPKLISIVGRLQYRTSYGQNILNHSIEVAHLCALMAEELGLDVAKAKRAGFFHDIGKSVDHDTQGTHTEIGYTILKKFKIDEDVAQAALTHHDTNPPLLLTKIVMAADAISASRVGARRDTYEQFVTRLEELEDTAKSFPGVSKVYAIQAGREIRVFVDAKQTDDYASYNLAKDIARKIETELTYPGEIKINVIRETRVIEYAR